MAYFGPIWNLMNAYTAKTALHELRRSAQIAGSDSVDVAGPMLQQFDLLALADALDRSAGLLDEASPANALVSDQTPVKRASN